MANKCEYAAETLVSIENPCEKRIQFSLFQINNGKECLLYDKQIETSVRISKRMGADKVNQIGIIYGSEHEDNELIKLNCGKYALVKILIVSGIDTVQNDEVNFNKLTEPVQLPICTDGKN